MPIHNSIILSPKGEPAPEHLQQTGPLIAVEILPHEDVLAIVQKQEKPIPTPVSGMALIDTGAAMSAVDISILGQLKISPVEVVQVHGVHGPQQQFKFPARFQFPGTPFPPINFSAVISANLAEQGIVALIGRDVLEHFVMIYNGGMGQFILCI